MSNGYPAAPWALHGSLWLSVCSVRRAPDRPDGRYGAAFVGCAEPRPLT